MFWTRFLAVFIKEFVQMRRDHITFAMMVGVPLMQLILFGYAINSDPKSLPTAVVMGDSSTFGRSIVTALQNSEYFSIVGPPVTEAEADRLLRFGDVQFVVTIPVDFSRDLVRGDRPTLLVEADATDPAATSNAIGALNSLNDTALDHDLKGPLAQLKNAPHAIAYLKKRGLSGDIAKRFGIGYAPDDWQNLAAAFSDYDGKSLVDAGLTKANDEGRRYDVFRNRILFPIVDARGNVIGFGGAV